MQHRECWVGFLPRVVSPPFVKALSSIQHPGPEHDMLLLKIQSSVTAASTSHAVSLRYGTRRLEEPEAVYDSGCTHSQFFIHLRGRRRVSWGRLGGKRTRVFSGAEGMRYIDSFSIQSPR